MSTYPAAELALLTLVRAYNGGATFTTTNSSADEWRVLDASGTWSAVVEMAAETREGDVLNSYGAHDEYQEVHQIGVWVCYKRGTGDGGDGSAKQALKTQTEALKDYLRRYERLNNAANVARARIMRTGAPSYISPTTDVTRATHVAQQIVLEVQCAADLDPLEVAAV